MNGGNVATCPTFSLGRGSVCYSLVVDNFIPKEKNFRIYLVIDFFYQFSIFKSYFLFPITKNLFGKIKNTEKRKQFLFLIYKEK